MKDISSPPSAPVVWLCSVHADGMLVEYERLFIRYVQECIAYGKPDSPPFLRVKVKTWAEARDMAAVAFGATRDRVVAVMETT